MSGELEGKVAIITGGVRGIGRATGYAFAQEGAEVAIFGRDPEDSPAAKELLKSLEVFKKRCLYKKADVTKMEEVRLAVEETIKVFGKVDILVNNAGGSIIAPVPLEDLQEEDWDRVVEVNLKGTYICTHLVIRHMKKQKSGKIINIASRAGRAPSVIAPLPYVCAKAGQIHFTRQVALEAAPYGINVNCIAPGTIFVDRVKKIFEERFDVDERRRRLESIPLGRAGKPEEVASLVLYLTSDQSNYITGATIDVNGGTAML
jgi:3-oxoacyl-[acyl-carrier protein] reductase